jgi:hypothetical protein
MGKHRDDLSEREIRFDLLTGMSVTDVAAKYRCSTGLVRKIQARKGLRTKRAPPDGEPLCTCCDTRPRHPELHFLCEDCFKRQENPDAADIDYLPPECGWWEDT